MALNLFPERVDPAGLRKNVRAIERHLDDDHYVRGFTPGDFVLLTATHALDTAANDWPWVEMVDGVTSHASVSFRKPSEWRTGLCRLRFWYTSDVGSTANFRILISVRALRAGEALPATSILFAAANYAGPAVAFTVLRSADLYTTVSLGADDELFSLRIVREGGDAADANLNSFHFLYAEVQHIPAVQEAT